MNLLKSKKIWHHKSKTECRHWLHWGDSVWHYEGYIGKKASRTSIGLDLGGDENDFTFNLGIKGLFNFYFGVENLLPSKIMRKLFGYDGRIYGIGFFEEYFCFDFHRDDYGYSDGWKGIHFMLDWKSKLFGKWDYKCEIVDTVRDYVKMPEGNYPATVTIKNISRGYKRAKKVLSTEYEIELDIPIPYQGKGENDYDCGEDGTYSSNLSANSLEEALQKVAESSLKYRNRYGGENWKPKDGWKV